MSTREFADFLEVAGKVFGQYRADQPKWWKRMDGTPILNDIAVRMARAFQNHAKDSIALAEQ